MGWISRLFGRKEPKRAEPKFRFVDEVEEEYAEVMDGWTFVATMNTRTPLEWLLRHGEGTNEPGPYPPEYGYWSPTTKSWAELGLENMADPAPTTMASQIGQIPRDGGDFLPFLIEYRQIVELGQSRKEMLKALDALGTKNRTIARKLGGKLSRQFVETELLTLPGCGKVTAQRLYDGKFRSADEVRAASIERLTAIPGIGKAIAAKLIA